MLAHLRRSSWGAAIQLTMAPATKDGGGCVQAQQRANGEAELTSFWGQQKAFNSRDWFVLLLGVNLDESAQKLGCGGGGG